MTIKELLEADNTIDRIDVTIRDEKTTRYIMRYCIGRDVEPGRSERYQYTSEGGDVYRNGKLNALYMNRIIQYRQLEKKAQGKEVCVGVLLDEIPKEIIALPASHIRPYHCGYSKGMHGYYIDSYVESWNGIPGENSQIEMEV